MIADELREDLKAEKDRAKEQATEIETNFLTIELLNQELFDLKASHSETSMEQNNFTQVKFPR
jgi:hypothetical protein